MLEKVTDDFDVSNNIVYWCENREWEQVKQKKIGIQN